MSLEIRLLGTFDATARGAVVSSPRRKICALLAFLSLAPRYQSSLSALAALLWGEHEENRAHASLRQTLAQLRKWAYARDVDMLQTEGSSVRLRATSLKVDVQLFRHETSRTTRSSLLGSFYCSTPSGHQDIDSS